MWRSIIKNLVRITTTVAGQIVDKVIKNYTDEDFEKLEEQERALATLTMALSPDIAQGFREYTLLKHESDAFELIYRNGSVPTANSAPESISSTQTATILHQQHPESSSLTYPQS